LFLFLFLFFCFSLVEIRTVVLSFGFMPSLARPKSVTQIWPGEQRKEVRRGRGKEPRLLLTLERKVTHPLSRGECFQVSGRDGWYSASGDVLTLTPFRLWGRGKDEQRREN
jgi:hypothetical protein